MWLEHLKSKTQLELLALKRYFVNHLVTLAFTVRLLKPSEADIINRTCTYY
ncbi:hypothetical protein LguiB_013390 [Lonicera macranthoides]